MKLMRKLQQRKRIHDVLGSAKWWNSLPITNSEWIDITTQTWWENCKSPQRKRIHDVLSSTKWWNSLPIRKIDSMGTISWFFELVNVKSTHLRNRTDIESQTPSPGTAKCYGFLLSSFLLVISKLQRRQRFVKVILCLFEYFG